MKNVYRKGDKLSENYDLLFIPVNETNFRDRRFVWDNLSEEEKKELLKDENFPVASKAAELFGQKKFDYVFISGGHSGLSNGTPYFHSSEAKDVLIYLKEQKGISEDNIYKDNQSRETLGSFALPFAYPLAEDRGGKKGGNPSIADFQKILLMCKEGHLERIMDYSGLVIPETALVDYYAVEGDFKEKSIARKYRKGLLNVLSKRFGKEIDAKKVADFLKREHPFYGVDWYETPLWNRKSITKRNIRKWMRE